MNTTIAEVDQALKDWVATVLEKTKVFLSEPSKTHDQESVGLYLIDLLPTPPARTSRRPPLQVTLKYLVTTWADQPEQAHHMLGKLLFAALENPDFEVGPDPLPATTWQAFGLAPRPSFMLRVPLRQERPEEVGPMVRVPMVVKHGPLVRLQGLVLGPGDVPVANAQVDLPALRLSTRTDARGRFMFASLPSAPPIKHLKVRSKGLKIVADVAASVQGDEPLVIRLLERET